MTESLKRVSMVLLALAITLGLYGVITLGITKTAGATNTKVFVCKYTGKPGVDESLQTGQNPISVSTNSIKDYKGVGSYFNDAQGRSLVVALDEGQAEPKCPEPEAPKKISPVLECVETVSEGQYIARFGYLNRNSFTVDVPVGNDNKITGGGLTGQDQGQTTDFQPGRVVDDFRVEFDGTNLVWTLAYGGQRATSTASANSTPCPQDKKATPQPITFVQATCEEKGTFTIPSTEGVLYLIGDEVVEAGTYEADNGTTITVTAKAAEGYYIEDENWSMTNTFNAPTDCVLGEETDVPAAVAPTTPTSLPNTGNSVATVVALMTAVSAGATMFSTTLRSALIKFNN